MNEPTPHAEKQLEELVESPEVVSPPEIVARSEIVELPEVVAQAARDQAASAHDFTHAMKMATKCKSEWAHMSGSDTLRQCGKCRLLVIKTQDLSEDSLSKLFYANEDFLARCDSNPLSALLAAKKGLFRRIDGAITIGNCYSKRVPSTTAVRIWGAAPFVFGLLEYVMAPGYLTPFLNHPVARIMILLAVAWNLLGCFLLRRTSHLFLQVLIVMVFMAPLGLLFMLGPAMIVIIQAIGPIMQTK